ncbi:MAG: hypothetical protein LUH36_02010 [Oscillospiraceae bacterium]|nr:hypothetical protein [Oscillospiraceae bacterium]
MKMSKWYFQGWEKRKDQNGKTEYVYVGEHYTLPHGLKQAKLVSGLLTGGAVIAYVLTAFFPSAGGMWRPAAPAQLLVIVPLLYLCIGTVNLLLQKEERLTYRDWYSSWRRMTRSSLWAVLLAAAMAVVELVYIVAFSGGEALGEELLYLLRQLICVGLLAAQRIYIQKNPCAQSM